MYCKKHDPNVVAKGEAKIKVINAVQGEVKQNVFVDNSKMTIAPLAFGETSEYVKILSGNRSVNFMGSNSFNTDTNLNFTPALTYSTFLIADRDGKKEIINFEDNLSISDMSMAKIRVVNLTPFFNTGVNVSIQTGSPFINALMFKEASNYYTIENGAALRYNVVGSGNIKTIAATDLLPGKIYTIWLSGLTTATLEAHLIVDN
ncbi:MULTISPECIES: DUF4397 domain-containing protein [unclassified Pedobacter]|uniref:DUF4397 domain-containing protein n=1 Tax=unclassified Pedobacter TaxID=2628915 RepID=UPI001E400CC2|nr:MULTISPECIES: DUF4397 domain-containing protein [unclassified Pedobacter]